MQNETRDKEERLAEQRAKMLGLRFFDTSKLTDLPLIEDLLEVSEMYNEHAVPISNQDGSLVIGITSRTPQSSLSKLKERFSDSRVSFVLISESGFKDFMKLQDPPKEVEYRDVALTAEHGNKTLTEMSNTIEQVLAPDLFDYLLRQAVRLEASDIHLESTREDTVRIRFRVHGVMHNIATLHKDKYRQLMSTIATLANIGSDSPVPQSGHISYGIDSAETNIRIETAKTLYGMDCVLRVFTVDEELMDLMRLGLNEEDRQLIEGIIDHPAGLILAVGPTGSGKTTTLYSIIKRLNSPSRKIITLEDPVEYSLPGLVQLQMDSAKNKKGSFVEGLRAIIRMDPDVIMVGEIRDQDTAATALQAALSGHLVLSTFHADDAAAALARLVTFSSENPLFSTALKLVIGQRLVRRLDDETKEAYDPPKQVLAAIQKELPDENLSNLKLYKPVASEGSPFGFSGRTAVVELLTMNEGIERAIHSGRDLVADEVRKLAFTGSRKTLKQAALLKVIAGETTIEEVYRVL